MNLHHHGREWLGRGGQKKKGPDLDRIPRYHVRSRESLFLDVAPLLEKFSQPGFPFREIRPGNESRKTDSVILRDLVQNPDRRSVP